MIYNAMLLSVLVILALFKPARGEDTKEHLRLQYTEFCKVVKPPPKILVDAVTQSLEADPKAWASSMRWLQELGDAYNKRKCGDV